MEEFKKTNEEVEEVKKEVKEVKEVKKESKRNENVCEYGLYSPLC